jgi:hypothetical protein
MKYRNRKNANRATSKVPLYTLEHLQRMGIMVKQKPVKKIKYVTCNPGYDILENLFVVRHYVCKTNKISFRILEMLLKLYPMNYFTYHDYFTLPKDFQLVSADYFLKVGFIIEVKEKGKDRTESIFKLTKKACKIVESFYKFLSGEVLIPENKKENHMARKDASEIDKLRFEFIKKMNKTEPSESKKELFE